MILLHGFPEFWFSWRKQLPEFNNDYYVIAPDLRGYGESEKLEGIKNYDVKLIIEDIIELMEILNKEKCILIGHDWGGLISWCLASNYPDKIEKAIIINSPHPSGFKDVVKNNWKQYFISWYMKFFNLPILPELLIRTKDLLFFNEAFKSFDGKQLFSPEEIQAYKYIYSKPNALNCVMNYYRANLKGEFIGLDNEKIKVKTLIIWGQNDPALCKDLAQASAVYCDDVTVRNIENCGHWVQHEHAETVNQYIREFLNTNIQT